MYDPMSIHRVSHDVTASLQNPTSSSSPSFSFFFFFFHWHYSPLWALACRTTSFHFFLFATNSLHLLTPSTWRSLSTSSFHLFLGLPLLLIPSSSWVKMFLGILSTSSRILPVQLRQRCLLFSKIMNSQQQVPDILTPFYEVPFNYVRTNTFSQRYKTAAHTTNHFQQFCFKHGQWKPITNYNALPKFTGSNPAKAVRIFQGEKILSTPSFGREVKPWVPCPRFAACKRSLNWRGSHNFR